MRHKIVTFKSIFFYTLFFTFLFSCSRENSDNINEAADLYKYVNPLIGTKGEGNTYPGAQVPFGMVQVGPDTETDLWETASGYEYSDSIIFGFSMTHLNGTGIPDLGDILFMPTIGKRQFKSGKINKTDKEIKQNPYSSKYKKSPEHGYMSKYNHIDEKASANYYSVKLQNYNIWAEMSATERAGIMKFTFPESDSSHIVADLSHVLRWDVFWSSIRVENDSTISGHHQVKGWANDRYVYFTAVFSRPFDDLVIMKNGKKVIYNTTRFRSSLEASGKSLQFIADYKTRKNEEISVKIGISAVSTQGAYENLMAEIPEWDFDKVRESGVEKWNKELNKIQVEGKEEYKEAFYTAFYHTCQAPFIFQDVNGLYRGFDKNIHKAEGFENYTLFSLWDTYRATHPLFCLVQRERNAQMLNSMLTHYDQSVDDLLPVWSFWNNETWCMIGYHAVPVIVDAYMKDLPGFDAERAYEAIKTTAMNPNYDNVKYYAENGYVPFDKENESVSKTLEYAYDDYCIAQMAKKMGKIEDYKYFLKRAMAYQNVFDPVNKLMRGKDSEGNWREPFDPHAYAHDINKRDITEGTNYQYTWYVPHDINGLINLMGGGDAFEQKLDTLFTYNKDNLEKGSEDILGRFGEYWHGNEPSHHIAFLYNYVNKPWKTQKWIHKIMTTQYGNQPGSLCGNDDCGQMSAWYIFNAMGFYPVCPGSNQYVIGTPLFQEAVINFENGRKFKMKANNISDDNIYIQSVSLNGVSWNNSYVPYSEIVKGGEILFEMGPSPNFNWAVADDSVPVSLTK